MKNVKNELVKLTLEITEKPQNELIMKVMQTAFKCQRCGKCCNDIGGVALSRFDIDRICKYRKCGTGWFEKNMLEPTSEQSKRLFLKGTKTTRKCPYYADGCTIYEGRPQVCRVYPLMNWDETGYIQHFYDDCPGTIELAQEIQVEQLLNGDRTATKSEEREFGFMIVQAFLKAMDLYGFEEQKKRYALLRKHAISWDESEDLFRTIAIKFLSFQIPRDRIDEYLCTVVKRDEMERIL